MGGKKKICNHTGQRGTSRRLNNGTQIDLYDQKNKSSSQDKLKEILPTESVELWKEHQAKKKSNSFCTFTFQSTGSP
jgi:hypothetical protein